MTVQTEPLKRGCGLSRTVAASLLTSLLMVVWLTVSQTALGVTQAEQFASPALEQRYNQLIKEFRCLVCQNQSLADSDADLAKDLRQKTAQMLREGNTDGQIRGFMQERFGDFVLYRTPFTAYTAFLWIAPICALLLGLVVFFRRSQRRQVNAQQEQANIAEGSLKRAKTLLNSPRGDDS